MIRGEWARCDALSCGAVESTQFRRREDGPHYYVPRGWWVEITTGLVVCSRDCAARLWAASDKAKPLRFSGGRHGRESLDFRRRDGGPECVETHR